MPTAYLKFKLPEEKDEFAEAVAAGRLVRVLTSLAGAFRSHRKYGGPVVEEKMFYEICTEHGVQEFLE